MKIIIKAALTLGLVLGLGSAADAATVGKVTVTTQKSGNYVTFNFKNNDNKNRYRGCVEIQQYTNRGWKAIGMDCKYLKGNEYKKSDRKKFNTGKYRGKLTTDKDRYKYSYTTTFTVR